MLVGPLPFNSKMIKVAKPHQAGSDNNVISLSNTKTKHAFLSDFSYRSLENKQYFFKDLFGLLLFSLQNSRADRKGGWRVGEWPGVELNPAL